MTTLLIGLAVGFVLFFVAMMIANKKYFKPEIEDEIEQIKENIQLMENNHYMLTLDVEKSRQKLIKSNSFLLGLKAKTKNYDMNKIRYDIEKMRKDLDS